MLQHAQIELARQRVEALTGIALPWPVSITESSDGTLAVTLKDGQAAICADGVNSLTRGFFLLTRAVKENRSSLNETQQRHFASCGPMIFKPKTGSQPIATQTSPTITRIGEPPFSRWIAPQMVAAMAAR